MIILAKLNFQIEPFQKVCFYDHVSSLLKALMKCVSEFPLHSNIEGGNIIRDTGIFEHCIISLLHG